VNEEPLERWPMGQSFPSEEQQEIADMIANLPTLGMIDGFKEGDSLYSVDILSWSCVGDNFSRATGFLNIPGKISVCNIAGPIEDEFPEHVHHEEQWLLCYTGAFDVYMDGERVKAVPGKMIHIPAMTPHRLVFGSESAELLAITVPDCEGFPDGFSKWTRDTKPTAGNIL
jgi:mannose-6-phosphate isomerase-like protein (cupin superfamily)